VPETLTPPTPDAAPDLDGMLYEVIDGRVVEKPAMSAFESVFASWLVNLMLSTGNVNQFGLVVSEVLFHLDPTRPRKRRPDVAFVSFERWPRDRPVPMNEAWEVVPDLAIEVISRSNTVSEVDEKLEEYFGAGVRLVWVVLPVPKKVYVYTSPTDVRILKSLDDLDGGPVLPGFRLPLGDLFRR